MGITGKGIFRGTRKCVQNQFLGLRMVPRFQKWFHGQIFVFPILILANGEFGEEPGNVSRTSFWDREWFQDSRNGSLAKFFCCNIDMSKRESREDPGFWGGEWFRGQTFFICNMNIAEQGFSKACRTVYFMAFE